MEDQIERLVDKTYNTLKNLPNTRRLVIGVSGIPGSGKTTFATKVVKRINERYRDARPHVEASEKPCSPIAALIPMDGFHLTRAHLSALPDPAHAMARRGAAFTFNGEAFLELVKRVREPIGPEHEAKTLYAPSFDHAIKDPVAEDIVIAPTARILVFEGNYLSLDESPWREAAQLMDELWFVEVDFDTALNRLVNRHFKAGIAADVEEARKMATENDLVNGKEIIAKRLPVGEIIISREENGWEL